jgi:hypothetical protein
MMLGHFLVFFNRKWGSGGPAKKTENLATCSDMKGTGEDSVGFGAKPELKRRG